MALVCLLNFYQGQRAMAYGQMEKRVQCPRTSDSSMADVSKLIENKSQTWIPDIDISRKCQPMTHKNWIVIDGKRHMNLTCAGSKITVQIWEKSYRKIKKSWKILRRFQREHRERGKLSSFYVFYTKKLVVSRIK